MPMDRSIIQAGSTMRDMRNRFLVLSRMDAKTKIEGPRASVKGNERF
jgi:hypothetical protein